MTISQDSSHPTGVVDTSPRGSSGAVRARERKARAAMQMKAEGHSWPKIAKTLGFPNGRAALVACELALEQKLLTGESQELMRQIASDRLERVLKPLLKRATNPNDPEQLAAAGQVRGYIREHADIMGYVAPKRTVVANPSMAQIEQWVSQLLHTQAPEVQERDLFDDIEDAVIISETDDDGNPV